MNISGINIIDLESLEYKEDENDDYQLEPLSFEEPNNIETSKVYNKIIDKEGDI